MVWACPEPSTPPVGSKKPAARRTAARKVASRKKTAARKAAARKTATKKRSAGKKKTAARKPAAKKKTGVDFSVVGQPGEVSELEVPLGKEKLSLSVSKDPGAGWELTANIGDE